MEEEEDNSPPFWLQTTNRRRSFRRQASSIFLNSGVILIILLVIAFVIVFIIIPSFVSFTSQNFKPNLIKKSWDSLNLALVLFAIICGFLSKNNNNNNDDINNESTDYQSIANVQHRDVQRSYSRWYDRDHEYQNRTAYNTLTRLRSFSSYPDLRLESFSGNDERWRFYDDTHIKNSYPFSSSSDQFQHSRPLLQQGNQETRKQLDEVKDVGSKDKEVVYTPPQPPPPPSSPHPPPSPPLAPPLLSPQLPPSKRAVRRKVKRTYQDLGHEKRREEDKDLDDEKLYVPPLPSPPAAPAPPLPTQVPPPKAVRRKVKRNYQDLEHEKRKEEEKYLEENKFYIPPSPPTPPPPPLSAHKKRGKDLLTALRRKKKKQRQKSVENLESLFHPEPSTLSLIPPPPPPPPPLPSHFFQNLFSSNKKGKSKKTHPSPSPPPPLPPPVKTSSSHTHVESRASRITAQVAEVTTHQPLKAVKTTANNFNRVEENVESGNASPVIPIPPPPPPPFKMRSWKFVRDGDYVRVASFNSSRSGSPDMDSEEPSDKESMSPMARKKGGESPPSSTTPLFYPSPDVNTKAENFIARIRAGLKLEKINSLQGRSNLGPPGPDPAEKEDPN